MTWLPFINYCLSDQLLLSILVLLDQVASDKFDLHLAVADVEQHSIVDNTQGPLVLSLLAWEPIPHSTTDSKLLNFGSIENSHSCCNFDVTAVTNQLLWLAARVHLHFHWLQG